MAEGRKKRRKIELRTEGRQKIDDSKSFIADSKYLIHHASPPHDVPGCDLLWGELLRCGCYWRKWG